MSTSGPRGLRMLALNIEWYRKRGKRGEVSMDNHVRSALENCLAAMEMQEGRMDGTLHIPAQTARPIWDEAKANAVKVLAIVPHSAEIVKVLFPRATAQRFPGSNDWEIYETEEIGTSYVLGSGTALPTTPAQDEINYKGTQDAAWDDAARSAIAYGQFRKLAADIVREVAYLVQGSPIGNADTVKYVEYIVARKILDAQEGIETA